MEGDDKYLGPRFNPMIPMDEDGKTIGPGQEGYDGRARFWSAEGVSRMIERAYPEVTEIVLGPHNIIRMADGSLRLNDAPLAEAPDGVLAELASALAICKR